MLRTLVETSDENYKQVKWSPDGSCLLSINEAKIATTHHIDLERNTCQSKCKISTAESINDACWYPWMRLDQPATSCYILVAKDRPVQLFDANTGHVRASYKALNHLDELDACVSSCFSPDGTRLFASAQERIYCWDSTNPGKASMTISTSANRRSKTGQKGLLSCIVPRWDQTGLVAVGSFNGSLGLYDFSASDHASNGPLMLMKGSPKGITQVAFDMDGWSVWVARRHSEFIECWDLRTGLQDTSRSVGPRAGNTNQRLYFSISANNLLATGNALDGSVILRPLSDDASIRSFKASEDIVCGIGWAPGRDGILATASGQRRLGVDVDCSPVENSIKIWQV